MAKGDKGKVEGQIKDTTAVRQPATERLNKDIIDQTTNFGHHFNNANNRANSNFDNIMAGYKENLNKPDYQFERINYTRSPELDKSFKGWSEFADTGGFSQDNIADIRARNISPIRAVYGNMNNALQRQKNLSGGYAPNMGAITSKMGREASSLIADKLTDTNAGIAEMVQKGRLAGLGGLSSLSMADAEMLMKAALANQSAGIETSRLNSANKASNLSGMSNLYGTASGDTSMFTNALLNSMNQRLAGEGQANQLENMLINGKMGAAAMPSDFEQGFGRIMDVGRLGANFATGMWGRQ